MTNADTPITAAEAFEAVRQELSLLRNAVAGLTAAREKIPDYTDRLAHVDAAIADVAGRLGKIERTPVLGLTPAAAVEQINRAAETVRLADRHMLDGARAALDRATGAIESVVKRGQAVEVQRLRLWWTACGGVVAGLPFWMILHAVVR